MSVISDFAIATHDSIFLKDTEQRLIGYKDIAKTRKWRRDIHAQDEAVRPCVITLRFDKACLVHRGSLRCGSKLILDPRRIQHRRIFNWNEGGRWYGA